MTGNLVQFGEMRARFLMPGDIIERHSLIFRVRKVSTIQFGRVIVTAVCETGGLMTLTMNSDLFIPKYDMVTDEEWAAVVGK
jgi:hypothetical protein